MKLVKARRDGYSSLSPPFREFMLYCNGMMKISATFYNTVRAPTQLWCEAYLLTAILSICMRRSVWGFWSSSWNKLRPVQVNWATQFKDLAALLRATQVAYSML